MKCIFLDVDGVINTVHTLRANGPFAFEPECIQQFKRILEETGAKFCISSSWRLHEGLFTTLTSALDEYDILHHYVGTTPDLIMDDVDRSAEIEQWLKENPEFDLYAVLDDDPDAGTGNIGENFFQTSGFKGLTPQIADKVILHLNR